MDVNFNSNTQPFDENGKERKLLPKRLWYAPIQTGKDVY